MKGGGGQEHGRRDVLNTTVKGEGKKKEGGEATTLVLSHVITRYCWQKRDVARISVRFTPEKEERRKEKKKGKKGERLTN